MVSGVSGVSGDSGDQTSPRKSMIAITVANNENKQYGLLNTLCHASRVMIPSDT